MLDYLSGFLTEMQSYPILYPLLAWSQVAVPVLAGVMLAYHFLMRIKAEDEEAVNQHNKAIRTLLAGTVAIVGLWGFFQLALRFTTLASYGRSGDATQFAPCDGWGWSRWTTCKPTKPLDPTPEPPSDPKK